MRFTKKIDTKQSGGAVAVSEPPEGDAIGIAEAEVAAWRARQQEIEGVLARLNSEYLASARAVAGGEVPSETPEVILERVAAAQIRRDGLAQALSEAVAKRDDLYSKRRAAAVKAEGEQHLVEFADAVTRLQDAEQRAEAAWWQLAESLFQMERATAQLRDERFRGQRGTDVVQAMWEKFRGLRLVAFNQNRPLLINTTIEVPGVGPVPEPRL